MLDYKKYMAKLASTGLSELTCPHCGSPTISTKGKNAFCNFCEQYTSASESEFNKEVGTEVAFAEVSVQTLAGNRDEAEKKVAALLKGSRDASIIYVSGLFYFYFSDFKYKNRDYGLSGFMEANSDDVRASLDLTSKWKECFFKVRRLVKFELSNDVRIDGSYILMKFMCEIKLGRLVEAGKTLKAMRNSNPQDIAAEYADMVYTVRKNDKSAESILEKMLDKGEINAFYYLAEHLAKQHRLDDAENVVKWLNSFTKMFMAQELQMKIESSQYASQV
jgi:hypothetical protein